MKSNKHQSHMKNETSKKSQTAKRKAGSNLVQSTGTSVSRAFGSTSSKRSRMDPSRFLDAFNPAHLGLPRPVGSYAVIRTTQQVVFNEKLGLFGPYLKGGFETTAIYCLSNAPDKYTSAMNGTGHTLAYAFDAMTTASPSGTGPASWRHARLVPSAFSIKVMNPDALQTTTGMIYIGRSRQLLNPGGDSRTWKALANELISYSSPDLKSAGALALNGCQVDCVPYDMTELSDFRPLSTTQESGTFTWSNDSYRSGGFAPVFIVNENQVSMNVLVCCEWRVQFDPNSPAYAAHEFHRAAPISQWERLMIEATSCGSGVRHIT